jgi:pimeloyl-ACP methyl ester carboxylesterase
MRVVDSHAHVDEYEAFGWFDPPEAMIELMDEAGIEKAVVITYADAPVLKPDALQYLYDACKKYAGRLIPGPVLAVGHSYGSVVITNAATNANNVVGLVYVAAFAPDEGENLADIESNSRDSVLLPALDELRYPTGQGSETAVEFAIKPENYHDAFAADLPTEQTAVLAATQRPIAELAFSEPSGVPAWKNLPSWAVVATGDKTVGADVVRSMAERAGATITEVESSHVPMISQPQVVTDVILTALAAVPQREEEA